MNVDAVDCFNGCFYAFGCYASFFDSHACLLHFYLFIVLLLILRAEREPGHNAFLCTLLCTFNSYDR